MGEAVAVEPVRDRIHMNASSAMSLPLLSLLPSLQLDDLGRLAWLDTANLQARSESVSARLLTGLRGANGKPHGWQSVLFETGRPYEVVWADGVVTRYVDGVLNDCAGAPAFTAVHEGRLEHFIDGQRSRWGGPAVISGKEVSYWSYGRRHRDPLHGPALELMTGEYLAVKPRPGAKELDVTGPARLWLVDGVLHRPIGEGPALVSGEWGEHVEFWVEGRRVNVE
jgi:hypothetical protein